MKMNFSKIRSYFRISKWRWIKCSLFFMIQKEIFEVFRLFCIYEDIGRLQVPIEVWWHFLDDNWIKIYMDVAVFREELAAWIGIVVRTSHGCFIWADSLPLVHKKSLYCGRYGTPASYSHCSKTTGFKSRVWTDSQALVAAFKGGKDTTMEM